jgi:Xaa-Pro aminopeptidase
MPLLFGTEMNESTERINLERMRRERADKLRDSMRKNGVASFLATRDDNLRYATGTPGVAYMPMMAYALIFAEAPDLIFWEHPGAWEQQRDQVPWIKPENWRVARSPRRNSPRESQSEEARILASEIKRELEARGLLTEKLACASGWDAIVLEAFKEQGITIVDGWDMMLDARKVKTKDEINCWHMANTIVDKAFYAAYEDLKPGATDKQIKGTILKSLWDNGISDTKQVIVLSGPYTFERGLWNTDRFIQVGDLVYIDIFDVNWLGYHTCIYRTFKVGKKPTDKEKDWYKELLEQNNKVIDEIKPGATTADAVKHFTPFSKMGYPDDAYMSMVDGGHGIGLAQYERPTFSRYVSLRYPEVFEPGMTLAVEAHKGERRVGGVRIEDMVLVTENGAEIVNHWPREEIVVTHLVV